MDAPEAPIQTATALLIDVDRLDAHSFPLEPDCETYIVSRLGQQSLKSAVGVYTDSDDPIYFDSLLKFPFDYSRDRVITFTLYDGNYEIAGYTIELNLFEHQKPTRCVRIKLKGHTPEQFGFLEMKFRLCQIELPKALSVKYYIPSGPRGLKSLTTPDSIQDFHAEDNPIKCIKIAIYKVDDVPSYYEDCVVTISLGEQSARASCVRLAEDLSHYSLLIDKTWTIPYQGHRFIKIKFEKFENDNVPLLLAQGEADIQKFILNRPNVLLGSQPLKHLKISSSKTKLCPAGVFYYRLEKCTGNVNAIEVHSNENNERPFSMSA